MEEYPIEEKGESFEPIVFEPIQIEQNEIKYTLNIKAIDENNITLSINDISQFPSANYNSSINFKEIKNLNKVLSTLNTLNDFYYFLKSLSNKKQLNIKKSKDKISLILISEIQSIKQEIKIDLYQTKKDINLNIKEIYQELLNIKNEIRELKKENIILKNDNNELKNKIDLLEKDNQKLNLEINNIKNEKKEKNKIDLLEKDNIINEKKDIEKNKINENKIDEIKIDDELVDQIYDEIENAYGISDYLEEDIIKDKIIELKYDREKITEWIEHYLENYEKK